MLRGPQAPTTSADHHQIALPLLLNGFCIEYILLQKVQFLFLPFKLLLILEVSVLALPVPSEIGNSFLYEKASFLLRTLSFGFFSSSTFNFLIQNHYVG